MFRFQDKKGVSASVDCVQLMREMGTHPADTLSELTLNTAVLWCDPVSAIKQELTKLAVR